MRVLVIGGTGFIGTAACKELMRRGFETVAASRTAHPYGTFTSHVSFDRRDPAALRDALEHVQPDAVLDLAAYEPTEVLDVLEHFRGRRYVFVSSGAVYQAAGLGRAAVESDFVPYEGTVPEAVLDYAEGKRWCESVLARSDGAPWIVLRPGAVLGPGDPTLRIAAYIQRVEDGGPLLVPEETFDRTAGLTAVRDIGFACALACDPRRGSDRQAYNCTFDNVSVKLLVEAIGRAMRREPVHVRIPYAELPPGASPYSIDPRRPAGYDSERACLELGFEASELEDALAETLAWYRVTRPSHPGYANRAFELQLAAAWT